MKLWPFSKKNETSVAAKPVNPHSRKMDLPQGVVLADPSESAFQPALPQPEAATAPLPNPAPEPEALETTTPSFADLSFIPEAPQGSTASSPDVASGKPDLTSFFEQNNLTLVSPSTPAAPTEDTTRLTPPEPVLPELTATTNSLDWMIPPELPELDNLSPSPDTSFSAPDATAELFATTEVTNPFDFFPPELQASSESDNTFSTDFFTIGEVPVTDTLPSNAPADFTDFTPPTAFNPVEQATLEASQADVFEAPTFDTLSGADPTPAITPESFQATDPEQASHDSFFLYTTGTELQEPSSTGLFDFGLTPEALTSNFEDEVAFLPEAPSELPPQLNLPDEALAPNGDGLFFEATGIQPTQEDDYAPEAFGDDTFDLDSLLLGESSPVSDSTEPAYGLSAAETYNLEGFEPTTPESKTLKTGKDHYFGDEADGLKGADNPDSYDFGHYEDPDEPSMAFCLEETIETDQQLQDLVANLSAETAHPSPPQTDQNLEQVPETFLQEVIAEESQSFMNMTSLPSGEDFLQSLAQPIAFDGSSAFQGSDEECEFVQEATDEEPEPCYPEVEQEVAEFNEPVVEEIPETMAAQPASTTHPPQNQPKQVFKPKPYQDSLADRIGSFEQEVLLKNSQFLSHSINDLVNAYFAQQTKEAS